MTDREHRGLEIAAKCRIKRNGFFWMVPSQSGPGKYSVVLDADEPHCTCPDHETRGVECKHIFAARFTLEREKHADGSETVTETIQVTETVKRTYPQDWPAYNAAQTCEKRLFQTLLHDLCSKVEDQPQRLGRPRLPLSDSLFAAIFKVYSTVSGRRFMCDLSDAQERGHINRLPHYNSIFAIMEDADVTPILKAMVETASLPLKAVETDFAADSSGFTTSRFVRWYDTKYGRELKAHDWIKVHIMCGIKTNVVTAIEIADRNANDAAQFPPMIRKTYENFDVKEVSADAAYLTHRNTIEVGRVGATPFIAFKRNSTSSDAHPVMWQKMYHLFQYNREDFMAHYHKRSNVESTFSMVKAKFRDHIRSKTDVAMVNECLCKFVCHNICCVIQSMHELGIAPTFWAQAG
jgi:transposase